MSKSIVIIISVLAASLASCLTYIFTRPPQNPAQSVPPKVQKIQQDPIARNLQILQTQSGKGKRVQAIAALAKLDLEMALGFIEGLPLDGNRFALSREVSKRVKFEDLSRFLEFIDRSQAQEENYLAWPVSERFRKVFTANHALEVRSKLNNPEVKRHVLGHAVKLHLVQKVEEKETVTLPQALEWMNDQEEYLIPLIQQQIMHFTAYFDPPQAIELMKSDIAFYPSEENAERVAKSFGLKGPDAGSDFVLIASEKYKNPEVVGSFVNGWLNADPLKASSWVDSLKSGPEKQSGIKAVVDFLERSGDLASKAIWEKQLKTQEKEQ